MKENLRYEPFLDNIMDEKILYKNKCTPNHLHFFCTQILRHVMEKVKISMAGAIRSSSELYNWGKGR